MIINTTQMDSQTWLLELSGRFDFQARHDFQRSTAQAEKSTPRKIILDVSQVSHIDSAGLGLLALTHKKLTPMGVQMIIVSTPGTTLDVLLLTNMDKLIPIYGSMAQATQAPLTSVPVET